MNSFAFSVSIIVRHFVIIIIIVNFSEITFIDFFFSEILSRSITLIFLLNLKYSCAAGIFIKYWTSQPSLYHWWKKPEPWKKPDLSLKVTVLESISKKKSVTLTDGSGFFSCPDFSTSSVASITCYLQSSIVLHMLLSSAEFLLYF